jgi:hypothetical protein
MVVLGTGDAENDARGRRGLDLEPGLLERVILAKEVVGGLAEVLEIDDAFRHTPCASRAKLPQTFQEGGTG